MLPMLYLDSQYKAKNGAKASSTMSTESAERPVLAKSGSIKRRDFRKSYSIEHGYTAQRRSLIEDAKFEHKIISTDNKSQQITEEDEDDSNSHVSHKLIISVGKPKTDLAKIMAIIGVRNFLFDHH